MDQSILKQMYESYIHCIHYILLYKTRSPAVARKSRPYRLHPKPSVWLPIMQRKRFLKRWHSFMHIMLMERWTVESYN